MGNAGVISVPEVTKVASVTVVFPSDVKLVRLAQVAARAVVPVSMAATATIPMRGIIRIIYTSGESRISPLLRLAWPVPEEQEVDVRCRDVHVHLESSRSPCFRVLGEMFAFLRTGWGSAKRCRGRTRRDPRLRCCVTNAAPMPNPGRRVKPVHWIRSGGNSTPSVKGDRLGRRTAPTMKAAAEGGLSNARMVSRCIGPPRGTNHRSP